MNIDYTAIIQKANDRKDALMRFEAAVRQLSSEINESGSPELIEAAYALQQSYNALDAEARALLPGNCELPLVLFVNNMLSMWAFVDKPGAGLGQMTPRQALYRLGEE